MRAWRNQHAEAYMTPNHWPGEAQVDFGYAHVILNGAEVKAALFVMTLMYSDAVFCCVFPRECSETFLEGHCRAFEFFGGVLRRIAYHNTKTAIKKIVGPRKRELTRDFLRLQSHYLFDCHFWLVGRPNEKGQVEGLVGFTRRNFMVPVPRISSSESLNANLEQQCRDDLQRRLRIPVTANAACACRMHPQRRGIIVVQTMDGIVIRTGHPHALDEVRRRDAIFLPPAPDAIQRATTPRVSNR